MSKEFQKTVIILGAGASKDYGFPVGGEIVKNLIDNKYKVLFTKNSNLNDNAHVLRINNEECYKYIYDNLNISLKEECWKIDSEKLLEKRDPYYLNLLDFNICQKFSQDLKLYRHSQIDYFLRTHKNYANFGKFMIAYEILKRESEPMDMIQNNYDNNKNSDWIGEFFAKIIQNAQQPEDLDKIAESLTIVTFNYDLLFEYYLDRFCQGDDEWGEALKRFKKKLKIIHIYGKLGRFDWEDPELLNEIYGEEIAKNFAIRNLEQQNEFGFTNHKYNHEKVFELSKGIQVIGGEKHQAILPHIKKAQEAIYDKNCQQIFFFGFGFDENNLRGPLGCELFEYKNKFKGKNIYATIHNEHEEERILLKVKDFIKNLDIIENINKISGKEKSDNLKTIGNFVSARNISSLLDYIFREQYVPLYDIKINTGSKESSFKKLLTIFLTLLIKKPSKKT